MDPTEFLGDPGRKKVRAGPVGSVYWNLAIRPTVLQWSSRVGQGGQLLADTADERPEKNPIKIFYYYYFFTLGRYLPEGV